VVAASTGVGGHSGHGGPTAVVRLLFSIFPKAGNSRRTFLLQEAGALIASEALSTSFSPDGLN